MSNQLNSNFGKLGGQARKIDLNYANFTVKTAKSQEIEKKWGNQLTGSLATLINSMENLDLTRLSRRFAAVTHLNLINIKSAATWD